MHHSSASGQRVDLLDEDGVFAEQFARRYLKERTCLREGESFKNAFFDMGNGYFMRIFTDAEPLHAHGPMRSFYTLTYVKLPDGTLQEREPAFWDAFMRPKARFMYAALGYQGIKDEMAFYALWARHENADVPMTEKGIVPISYERLLRERSSAAAYHVDASVAGWSNASERVAMGERAGLLRRKMTTAALRGHLAAFAADDVSKDRKSSIVNRL